jgi:biotin carboxyl carrier protein
MKKIVRFELEGKIYEVSVERTGDRLTLTLEGKRYTVSLLPEETAPAVSPPQSPAKTLSAAAMPQVSSPTSRAMPAAAPTAEINSEGALNAPMTGVIKEIKVGPGHSVEEGQVVLIMEAMKMDIDVPSPVAGIVAEVSVKPGDTVNAKQQLMVIH